MKSPENNPEVWQRFGQNLTNFLSCMEGKINIYMYTYIEHFEFIKLIKPLFLFYYIMYIFIYLT